MEQLSQNPSTPRRGDGNRSPISPYEQEVTVVKDRNRSSRLDDYPTTARTRSTDSTFISNHPHLLPFARSAVVVVCWSFYGTAARVALTNATASTHFFTNSFATVGPNCVGCFLMGIFAAALCSSSASSSGASAPPSCIFIALGTGFCGSLTTLCSWMGDAVMESTSASRALSELLAGLTMPFLCYVWGRDGCCVVRSLVQYICCRENNVVADKQGVIEERRDNRGGGGVEGESRATHVPVEPSVSAARASCGCFYHRESIFMMLSLCVTGLIVLLLYVTHKAGRLTRITYDELNVVILSPIGALPRFVLSTALNGYTIPWGRVSVPFGTLCSNMLAVMLLAGVHRWGKADVGARFWISQAIPLSISGTLSTVSSFVHECVTWYQTPSRRGMAYLYVLVTVVATGLICLVGRP